MRQVGGGVWYEPAELGFDNVLIAPISTVTGNVVPWLVRSPLRRVVLFFEIVSGASVSFTLSPNGADPVGNLIPGSNVAIWSNIAADSFAWWADDSTPLAWSGVITVNRLGAILSVPYISFNINNNDAVNPGNVSLRVMVGS